MNKELKKFMRAHFVLIFTGSFLNIFGIIALSGNNFPLAIVVLLVGIVNLYITIIQMIAAKRIGWAKDDN